MLEKIKKIKKKFSSRKSLYIISVVVLMILLIGSTVAWFVLNNNAGVDGFGGKVSQYDFGIFLDEECTQEIDDAHKLEFNVDKFINVTDGKMAPGTTGKIRFWVKTTSDVVTQYRVSVDNKDIGFDFSEYTQNNPGQSAPDEIYYSNIIKEHIRFYQDSACTIPIDMTKQFTGELHMNDAKEVDVYWKWLYEGDDLLSELKVDGYATNQEQSQISVQDFLTDWNTSNGTNYGDISEFLKAWDDDDNSISQYRDYITGNTIIYAYGTQQEPTN